jgi:hypothetical protein
VTWSVGTVSDVPHLLRVSRRPPTDIDTAIARDWLWREKIEGVWLYGTTDDAIDLAGSTVETIAMDILDDWLLGPTHPLSGYIAKKNSITPSISKNAVQIFIRSMLRCEKLDAIAILTSQYQPYLIAFKPIDNDEITRQISFLESHLLRRGKVSQGDLPEPMRNRTFRAWRATILQHGEYLGVGRMESGVLVAWL